MTLPVQFLTLSLLTHRHSHSEQQVIKTTDNHAKVKVSMGKEPNNSKTQIRLSLLIWIKEEFVDKGTGSRNSEESPTSCTAGGSGGWGNDWNGCSDTT